MGDSIDNYQIYNLVGRGGFAQVYRAKCRDTGEEVAIKMIDKETIVKKRMETRVQKEVGRFLLYTPLMPVSTDTLI